MASKLTKVLFNDGEGLDFNDLNDLIEEGRKHAVVALLSPGRGGAGSYEGMALSGSQWLHVTGDSCAPKASATNLTVDVLGGLITHSTSFAGAPGDFSAGASLGAPATYAAYLNELRTTHAGGAGSDRWDLVSLHLSEADGGSESRDFEDATTRAKTTVAQLKQRNVIMTKTLTAGTPGSGVIPACPAGDVPLYAVMVPTGAAGVLLNSNIRDLRMPQGRFSIDVYAREELARGALVSGSFVTGSVNGAFGYVSSPAANHALCFIPRAPLGHAARLISVQTLVGESSTATLTLRRFNALSGGTLGGSTLLADLTSTLATSTAAGDLDWTSTLVGVSQTAPASCPFWINGWQAGYANRADGVAGHNHFDHLGFLFSSGSASEVISMVRFNFAGGL